MLHEADGQIIKGTVAVENLQQLEQQRSHREHQYHHAGHTADDGAVVGEHFGRAMTAQSQIQNDAAQIAGIKVPIRSQPLRMRKP